MAEIKTRANVAKVSCVGGNIKPANKTIYVVDDPEEEIRIGASVTTISSSATVDYEDIQNKPQIQNVELSGNKTFEDLGAFSMSNSEIEDLINSQIF